MSPTGLRVVVADDEGPARRFLIALLGTCDGVELVGEATTGLEALALIDATHPDLVLLDVQMPELGGLDVARRLKMPAVPLVVFVTALDHVALEAFELNVIAYVLKPVDRGRLTATLDRARDRLARAGCGLPVTRHASM